MPPKGGNPLFRDPEWQRKRAAMPRKKKADTPPPAPAPAPVPDLSVDDQVKATIRAALPELVDVLLDNVRKRRDKTAAIYLIDRVLGPPPKAIDKDENFLRVIERLGRTIHEDAVREANVASSTADLGDGGVPSWDGPDGVP